MKEEKNTNNMTEVDVSLTKRPPEEVVDPIPTELLNMQARLRAKKRPETRRHKACVSPGFPMD